MQDRAGLLVRFSRFLVVGGLGFVVDAGILAVLLGLGLGPFVSRAVSITVAVILTWRLNRVAFGPSQDGGVREFGRYLAVVAGSTSVNAAVYGLALTMLPGLSPLIALILGSAAGLGLTFTGCSRFAFRAARDHLVLSLPASRPPP